ncbi:beta-ketoacyl synthase N-terminal-like domain-containing protein [Streptomyces sp. NPDC059169]|uniref:beta-ketoacyl synthase N-terminal-like domain-containing protein n=1 Tax=Streptomyces sp. NPDC059169 TaxID=3346754 RepID=UPI0036832F38
MGRAGTGATTGTEGGGRAVPVALVGMAVLLPGAPDLGTYWRNLVGGVDAIGDVPEGRWDAAYYRPGPPTGPPTADEVYCRRGGFVDALAEVEVTRFGIMPSSVRGTEPDQLIALHVAASALADAGGEERLPPRERIGVVLGRGGYLTPGLVRLDQRVRTAGQLVHTLGELLPDLAPAQLARVREAFVARLDSGAPESAIGLVPNLAASRVANRLDLRGPAYTVDAACASSLVAVDQAVGELATGRCDLMLAGGVHHCHDITLWSVFSQLRALSPSQRIRPFHRGADGILIGEGTGVVVLKRLADAERDGDRIYAVIRGTAVSSDGRTSGLVNPDPGGQVRAVREAWRAAGLDPSEPGSIGLLEAHGTATPAGDAAELTTLARVFGPVPAHEDRSVIGSVKSMIGHAMPAAGVAGLVKAALAVHHGTLLPTLHCDEPHPALADTRFRPLAAAAPWESRPGSPVRRAAVNAFGFGGINAHVVLEQAPEHTPHPSVAPPRPAAGVAVRPAAAGAVSVSEPERVLLLSATTPQELARLLDAEDPAVRAAGTARAGVGNAPEGCRIGIVDPTDRRLALARRAVAKGRAWRGRNDLWFAPRPLLRTDPPGRVAFVFPGLEGEFAPRVDDVADHFGLDRPPSPGEGRTAVGDVGRHGLGVVAVGRLLDAALRRMGVVPEAVAGHSIGEWTAMAAAGLYEERAVDDFMASLDPDSVTVPDLAFAAVGAPAERVLARLAADRDRSVTLSHDNAPSQSMVCGPPEAVEAFVRGLRAEGVLCRVLPFRSGFHTPMLAPLLGPFRAAAERFALRTPTVPVWSGTTASPYPVHEPAIRELFVRHLLEPVRFRSLTEALYAAGFRVFVQAGPGQLGSLVADTLAGREHLVVTANSPHRSGLAQLRRVAVALWTEGAEVVPDRLDRGGDVPPSTTRTTGGASRPPVRLDLGGALVSLAPDVLAGLRPALAGTAAPAPPADAGVLAAAAERYPVMAELNALLRDASATAAEVIAAAGVLPGRASVAPAPRTAAGRSRTPVVRAPGVGAAPAAPAGRTTVHVGPDTMPHLLDHCFFRQRPDWPDVGDRWPVVPATTIVHHLMEAAEQYVPGMRAVAVHDARFDRWLTAAEPVDVAVTVTPSGPNRVSVSFGADARAVVELAQHHPAAPAAPGPAAPGTERQPAHTARELYDRRWMFHGPAYQGVTALTGIGDRHVRAVLTTPPAPGALLDNVGQVLGYWIMATATERTVVFPVRMRHMRFFGPPPPPGTRLDCLVRITSLTDTLLEADAVLTSAGTVWAQLSGWQDRRFDNDPQTRPVERFPERNTLSSHRPGGWSLVHERWPDLASRELVMRNMLGGGERSAYERHAPRGRRQWLLGRIAAKDAVRRWLWDRGEGPVFPAELSVGNDERGRPRVTGVHGRILPPLDVSLAHCAEAGVALVRPRSAGPVHGTIGPGIDIEAVAAPEQATVTAALGVGERDLLASCPEATGEPHALWFTRFWTAKEAAAKAEGTGFGGRPKDFAVVAAERDLITVEVRDASGDPVRTHRVRCEQVANPPGLPPRDYVVAWTEEPGRDSEEEEGT